MGDPHLTHPRGDLLERWPDGQWEPDLQTGLAVQAVCEAIERAAAQRRWVDASEVAAPVG